MLMSRPRNISEHYFTKLYNSVKSKLRVGDCYKLCNIKENLIQIYCFIFAARCLLILQNVSGARIKIIRFQD